MKIIGPRTDDVKSIYLYNLILLYVNMVAADPSGHPYLFLPSRDRHHHFREAVNRLRRCREQVELPMLHPEKFVKLGKTLLPEQSPTA
jgi:hypothetical protein